MQVIFVNFFISGKVVSVTSNCKKPVSSRFKFFNKNKETLENNVESRDCFSNNATSLYARPVKNNFKKFRCFSKALAKGENKKLFFFLLQGGCHFFSFGNVNELPCR